MEWLVDFLDFRLHQQFHIKSDLAAASGDKAEEAADLGDAIADRMPRNLRLAELELLHQLILNLESVLAERRECAGGAAEFSDQHARLDLFQTLLVPLEGGEHSRHLVSKGDRHGLLKIAASRHRRVTILLGECRQSVADAVDVLLDEGKRL